MTKYIIVKQVNCVYRDTNGVLEYAPLYDGDTFYDEEFDEVDEELVGTEPLPEPYGTALTFKQLYEKLRAHLRGCDHDEHYYNGARCARCYQQLP